MSFTSDAWPENGCKGCQGAKEGPFAGVEAAPVVHWEWHPFHPEGSKGQQGRLTAEGHISDEARRLMALEMPMLASLVQKR
jgi:hypothetical protein